MKSKSRLRKVLGMFATILVLIQTTGCYSSKRIMYNDLPVSGDNPQKSDYYYVDRFTIFTEKGEFSLKNATIKDGFITGTKEDIEFTKKHSRIDIHFKTYPLISFDHGQNTVSVPIDENAVYYYREFDYDSCRTVRNIFLISAGIFIIMIPFWVGAKIE